MVNESGIIVLPRQFWVSAEIKMLQCEGFSSKLRYDFEIPNGENVRNLVTNVVLKFQDDPTVNESEIIVFLRQVWWAAGKRKSFERRRGKMKMRPKRGT